MSNDVVWVGRTEVGRTVGEGFGGLARREAWRLLTSPAVFVFLGYFVLVGGVEAFADVGDLDRRNVAEILSVFCLLALGLISYIATHLVATSARRGGAEGQLAATPIDPLRRDLALCLGVLLGPAALALGLALLAAWVASGVGPDPSAEVQVDPWSVTDVVQVPAMVLGAGVLGVVVARWLRFPGSLLVGFFGMIFFTGWTASSLDWFTWFAIVPWFSDIDSVIVPSGAMAWHAAYLVSWSVLGVSAVGLRQAEHKRAWLVAMLLAAGLVSLTGWAQLSAQAVPLELL